MTKYSNHIFLFPFKWYPVSPENFHLETYIQGLKENETPLGKLEPFSFEADNPKAYNEFTYFYDFAGEALYDQGNDLKAYLKGQEPTSYGEISPELFFHLQHNLEHREIPTYYSFKVKGVEEPYHLRIDSILVNFYEMGVGVLSFHLINDKYPVAADILKINQFGRRLFPQFITFGLNPLLDVQDTLLPEWMCIQKFAGHSEYRQIEESYDNFSRYADIERKVKKNPFMVPRIFNAIFPKGAIQGLNDEDALPSGIRIYPVLDDRMFVVSWYKPDESVPKDLFTKRIDFAIKETYSDAARDFWYQYIYIDHDGPTSVNDRFTTDLLEQATYTRWSGYRSLFGVTRYSLMALSGFDPLQVHMETIYFRMAELCLVQRAMILRFSDEATNLSRKKLGKISKQELRRLEELHQNYLRFINKIYFREITAQDQGIEMYDKLQQTLRLPQQVKDLEGEIATLYQYGQLVQEDRRNKQLDLIAWVGGLFLLPSVLLAFLGITEFSSGKVVVPPVVEWSILISSGLMALGGIIAVGIQYFRGNR
ncbi:MAG: hypothetical protein R3D00_10980 [Bacteroidia bacterium]